MSKLFHLVCILLCFFYFLSDLCSIIHEFVMFSVGFRSGFEKLASGDVVEVPEFETRTVEEDYELLTEVTDDFRHPIDIDYIMASIQPRHLSTLSQGWSLACRPCEGGIRDVIDHRELKLVMLFSDPFMVFIPESKVEILRKKCGFVYFCWFQLYLCVFLNFILLYFQQIE